MASKRAMRRKCCEGKVRHDSYEDANHARVKLYRQGRAFGKLNAYPCPFCNGWHVGHYTRKQKRAMRMARY